MTSKYLSVSFLFFPAEQHPQNSPNLVLDGRPVSAAVRVGSADDGADGADSCPPGTVPRPSHTPK